MTAQLAGTTLADQPERTSQMAFQKETTPTPPAEPKKRNRARERLTRRAAQAADDEATAAAEAATMVDHAALERAALAPLLARSGRVEHYIRADGHCLFSAVADQLAFSSLSAFSSSSSTGTADPSAASASSSTSPLPVRLAAARYMEAHADDFAPFVLDEDGSGDFAAYVARIRDTAEWGGQLELRALASAYAVDIRVLHDGRSELIRPAGAEEEGEGDDNDHDQPGKDGKTSRPTLWLVYYRHGFGLGEHYNSLRPKPQA